MIGNSHVLGKLNRLQREVDDVPIPFYVDVDGLAAIRAEKHKAIKTDPQNRWHWSSFHAWDLLLIRTLRPSRAQEAASQNFLFRNTSSVPLDYTYVQRVRPRIVIWEIKMPNIVKVMTDFGRA
jgi:hypothetical protein